MYPTASDGTKAMMNVAMELVNELFPPAFDEVAVLIEKVCKANLTGFAELSCILMLCESHTCFDTAMLLKMRMQAFFHLVASFGVQPMLSQSGPATSTLPYRPPLVMDMIKGLQKLVDVSSPVGRSEQSIITKIKEARRLL